MKKYIIYSLILTLTCGLGACNNDEDVDKANSIFSTEEVDRNPFDKWIVLGIYWRKKFGLPVASSYASSHTY